MGVNPFSIQLIVHNGRYKGESHILFAHIVHIASGSLAESLIEGGVSECASAVHRGLIRTMDCFERVGGNKIKCLSLWSDSSRECFSGNHVAAVSVDSLTI